MSRQSDVYTLFPLIMERTQLTNFDTTDQDFINLETVDTSSADKRIYMFHYFYIISI